MIIWIKAIDGKIIDIVQRAYLWLFDWTGVYIGTICAALYLLVFATGDCGKFDVALAAINIACFASGYWLQSSGNKAAFNAAARNIRDWLPRIGMTIGIIIFNIVSMDRSLWSLAGDVLIILVLYLLTVQIRDREPKNWFRNPLASSA